MEAAKRARLEEGPSPKEETEPKLKCHEMRLIFQRLPTSELIRFISILPKHPLGKFWSQELKFVVEKRLPFSIKATATTHGVVSNHVMYDCNGSRVAEVKFPKHFHLSPICALIESAELPAIALDAAMLPQFMFPIPDILSSLTNLDTLVLSVRDVTRHNLRDPVDLPASLNPEVLSRIKSLTLPHLYCYGDLKKPLIEIISQATNLKKLSVPYVDVGSQILLAACPPNLPGHYSSVESLSIKLLDDQSVQPLLEIITTRFNGLRELFLPVRAPIRQYLAAFQALPSLVTLGLDALRLVAAESEKQLAVDENDEPVVSVTELLIACWSSEGKAARVLLALLSKFPNVRTFGADFGRCVTDFASAVCAGGVFGHLQSLKLFCTTALTHDALMQFIRANIDHLPSCVDLSQVEIDIPRKVDRDFLVDLCLALEGSRITSLALKDLVHRDAVRCLRENFALAKQDKSTPQAEVGKILAWIDEGSIDGRSILSRSAPQAVSGFTDFRIEAYKTSGPLKGSAFKAKLPAWFPQLKQLQLDWSGEVQLDFAVLQNFAVLDDLILLAGVTDDLVQTLPHLNIFLGTAMESAERAELEAVQSSKEEKEPNLKCHEMRLIFQRLPTSELIRFISNQPNHPLGKFWSQELKFVVEKRLPFSLKSTVCLDNHSVGFYFGHVIFDCNGNRVAEMKRPEYLHLSPICELIESAEVPTIEPNTSSLPPQFISPTPDILSTLTNLDTLILSAHRLTRHNLRDPVDLPAALNPEVMSRIKSLTIASSLDGDLKKPLLEIISRATSLKKLSVSSQILLALPSDLPGHYSGLDSLSIKCLDVQSVQPLLVIITTRFNGLRELFLPVRFPIRYYLAAFQGLPSLATLGLDARGFGLQEAEKQFPVDENAASVVSVTELLIACWSLNGKATRPLLAMLSKFPNVRTLGADFSCDVTDFASAVCAGGIFSHLQALKLSCSTPFTRDALLQFIRTNIDHLPSCVDLSQVNTAISGQLDRDFLVDLCLALQGGRVTALALKDLVHREAVTRWREHFALIKQLPVEDKSTPQAKVGKILAWIDEGSIDERRIYSSAAWWPEEVSDFTDFRIETCKTSGPLKGSAFKVRICDWTLKRERLFEA